MKMRKGNKENYINIYQQTAIVFVKHKNSLKIYQIIFGQSGLVNQQKPKSNYICMLRSGCTLSLESLFVSFKGI